MYSLNCVELSRPLYYKSKESILPQETSAYKEVSDDHESQ